MFQRVVATILLLCFGLFSLEALIADVHDGDAPATEVAGTGVRPSAEPAGDQAKGAVAVLAERPSDDRKNTAPPSGHDKHACHCVHSHGFSVSRGAALPELYGARTPSIVHVPRVPGQVDLLPHLRPPIA